MSPVHFAVLFAVAGLALPAPAGAQTVEGQVDAVGEELSEARSQQLHLIAPRHFQRATEKLSEARQRLEEGRSINDIRDRLAEARQALSRAAELREVGSVLLRDAMEAREDALAANAPDFAPEIWEEGASRLHEAGRKVEDGDQNDARRKAAEAQAKFREAERTAIERSLLGEARELRQRRAIAVREYLLANMSMSADRIRAEGYGESEPIATNDTEEGRSKNRRIDVVLEMPGR